MSEQATAAMELARSSLTREEDYALETAGFLVVENALSPTELRVFTEGRAHAHDNEARGDECPLHSTLEHRSV